MGRADFFKEGSWNVACDRCGFKWKASDTAKEWQGQITCPQCFEPRHPQDHVRGKRDKQSPPWTRPQKTPVFVSVRYVWGRMEAGGRVTAHVFRDVRVHPSLTASGVLTGDLQRDRQFAPSMSAAGNVAGDVRRAFDLAPSLSASGSVTATVLRTKFFSPSFSASGSVTASITVTEGQVETGTLADFTPGGSPLAG